MRPAQRARLEKLARLAGILREHALAEHAAKDAARRETATRIREERRRRAEAAAGLRLEGGKAASPSGLPPALVEAYLDASQRRLQALGAEHAAAAARSEESRTRAARALGRAEVLDRLAREAGEIRRPGGRGR